MTIDITSISKLLILKTILCVIFIYLILIYLKLDNIDRLSIYYLLKYKNSINTETSLNNEIYGKYFIKYILSFLLIPFKSRYYLAQFSEGAIYSTHIPIWYDKEKSKLLNNKLFRRKIFLKYKINHPKLIAYNINNCKKFVSEYNKDKEYIRKPINGALGYQIIKIKGNDINNLLINDTLIQELLVDCKITNKIRNFRYVSLYNGESFILNEITNSNNKIAANGFQGGKKIICKHLYCNTLSYQDNLVIKNIINQLNILHCIMFNNIFYIEWDFILNGILYFIALIINLKHIV